MPNTHGSILYGIPDDLRSFIRGCPCFDAVHEKCAATGKTCRRADEPELCPFVYHENENTLHTGT